MMEILRAEGGKDRVVVDLSQITLSVCLCLTLCMLEALFLALSLFHFLFSPPLSLSLSLPISSYLSQVTMNWRQLSLGTPRYLPFLSLL
jgi:hypothetical protein